MDQYLTKEQENHWYRFMEDIEPSPLMSSFIHFVTNRTTDNRILGQMKDTKLVKTDDNVMVSLGFKDVSISSKKMVSFMDNEMSKNLFFSIMSKLFEGVLYRGEFISIKSMDIIWVNLRECLPMYSVYNLLLFNGQNKDAFSKKYIRFISKMKKEMIKTWANIKHLLKPFIREFYRLYEKAVLDNAHIIQQGRNALGQLRNIHIKLLETVKDKFTSLHISIQSKLWSQWNKLTHTIKLSIDHLQWYNTHKETISYIFEFLQENDYDTIDFIDKSHNANTISTHLFMNPHIFHQSRIRVIAHRAPKFGNHLFGLFYRLLSIEHHGLYEFGDKLLVQPKWKFNWASHYDILWIKDKKKDKYENYLYLSLLERLWFLLKAHI